MKRIAQVLPYLSTATTIPPSPPENMYKQKQQPYTLWQLSIRWLAGWLGSTRAAAAAGSHRHVHTLWFCNISRSGCINTKITDWATDDGDYMATVTFIHARGNIYVSISIPISSVFSSVGGLALDGPAKIEVKSEWVSEWVSTSRSS